jgi:hypothetical protein
VPFFLFTLRLKMKKKRKEHFEFVYAPKKEHQEIDSKACRSKYFLNNEREIQCA